MADTLTLYFTQDQAGGEDARVNFGVLPNNTYVGNDGTYLAVTSTDPAAPTVFTITKADIPADSSFFVTFVNDYYDFATLADRNVTLERAEINGVEIPGAGFTAFNSGDYGPFYFDGDAVGPDPEPEPGLTITGTAGNDTLTGAGGPDTISGLGGADVLSGLAGDDTILGGTGSDRIDGGPGDDDLTGGGGADLFIVRAGEGADNISDFGSTDRLLVVSGDFALTGNVLTFPGQEGSVTINGPASGSLGIGVFSPIA